MKCCQIDCSKLATYRIEWGEVANPDNYTEACEAHVGSLLGHHPYQPAPDHYRVYPIDSSPLEPLSTPDETTYAGCARLDKELEKEVENRDHNADYADQLTNMIGVLLEQDMGEHSSGNEPWENAIEALRVAIGSKQSPVEPTRYALTVGGMVPHPQGTWIRYVENGFRDE
jgi:hypothetical protein